MAVCTMSAAELRLIRYALAAVWLVTGILVLGVYPKEESLSLLARVGLSGLPATAALYLAALLDILLGVLTLLMRSRLLWILQAVLILGYSIIISICLPEFLLHPFGPILKNIPILVMLWLLHKHEGATA